jgi:hypothetical protein
MSRTFHDSDLLIWEAYASAGDFGLPEPARIIFHCLSDLHRLPRFLQRPGNKSAAEQEIVALSDAELYDMLRNASDVN